MSASRRTGRALVLLSGGMDSATALYWAKARSTSVEALTIHYGQRHARELRSARAIARSAGVDDHLFLHLPLGALLRSGLTDPAAPLRSRGVRPGIPSSYVPARNTIFLALALGVAESRRCDRIVLGINAVDYSGYPDCRPEYLRAFRRLARLATKSGVEDHREPRVVAPLLTRSKTEIVRWGERLRVPWDLTWSCYLGGPRPCGRCDSCRLRAEGFRGAGRDDPLLLAKARRRRAPQRRPAP